jgi:hypothetical protein
MTADVPIFYRISRGKTTGFNRTKKGVLNAPFPGLGGGGTMTR